MLSIRSVCRWAGDLSRLSWPNSVLYISDFSGDFPFLEVLFFLKVLRVNRNLCVFWLSVSSMGIGVRNVETRCHHSLTGKPLAGSSNSLYLYSFNILTQGCLYLYLYCMLMRKYTKQDR